MPAKSSRLVTCKKGKETRKISRRNSYSAFLEESLILERLRFTIKTPFRGNHRRQALDHGLAPRPQRFGVELPISMRDIGAPANLLCLFNRLDLNLESNDFDRDRRGHQI